MRDQVLSICRQLLRIDNRPDKDVADVTGLTAATIHRLRNGADVTYVRSTTVSAIAGALRHVIVSRHKPR